jgi:hypothetical protein
MGIFKVPLTNLTRVVFLFLIFLSWPITLYLYYGIKDLDIFIIIPKIFNYFSVSFPIFLLFCAILIISEGVFSKTYMPYLILRKRIDDQEACGKNLK